MSGNSNLVLATRILDAQHVRAANQLTQDLTAFDDSGFPVQTNTEAGFPIDRISNIFKDSSFLMYLKNKAPEVLEHAVFVMGANGLQDKLPHNLLSGAERKTSLANPELQDALNLSLEAGGHVRLMGALEAVELQPDQHALQTLSKMIAQASHEAGAGFYLGALDPEARTDFLARAGVLIARYSPSQHDVDAIIAINRELNDANPAVLDQIAEKGWQLRNDFKKDYDLLMSCLAAIEKGPGQITMRELIDLQWQVTFAEDSRKLGFGFEHLSRNQMSDFLVRMGCAVANNLEGMELLCRALKLNETFNGGNPEVVSQICKNGLLPRIVIETETARNFPDAVTNRKVFGWIPANAENRTHFAMLMRTGLIELIAEYPETHSALIDAMTVILKNTDPNRLIRTAHGLVPNPSYDPTVNEAASRLGRNLPELMILARANLAPV